MDRHDIVRQLRDRAASIRGMGATALYLFGSSARGEAGEGSDIDLFIDYDRDAHFSLIDLVRIKQLLEDEMAAPVDITTRDGLHPLLKEDIERSSIRVF